MIGLVKKVSFPFSYQKLAAIEFTYSELQDPMSNLNDKIEKAYGPRGLGVSIVSDIPGYIEFRQKLLPQAFQLASLPSHILSQYERPEQFYQKGWSCGVEQFKGVFDASKGSLYNNPLYDCQDLQQEQIDNSEVIHPQSIPNVWPTDTIPNLEGNFKALGRLMVDVGALLAQHIDKFVHSQCSNYDAQTLYRIVKQGDSHTGRLLHYYHTTQPEEWCGWHNDHSALTALTAPIYLNSKGEIQEDFVDQAAGLVAKNRFSEIIKLGIKKNSLAFQIGETLQILSGGIVEATPHSVIQSQQARELELNRNTFAVFMGPHNQKVINPPKGIAPAQAMNKDAYNVPSLQGRWKPNITFGEYSSNSFKAYAAKQ